MEEIIEYQFGITQLDESEIRRLVTAMEENGIKCSKYGKSITIALTYENIKFVCLSYYPKGVKEPSPQICAAVFPDKVIFADCFSHYTDKNGYHKSTIDGSTGNPELDELFSQMAFYSPLWEENIFAWLVDIISDGEALYPYEDEFEELRSKIIEYEWEMQKKYLTEKTVRPY